MNKFCLWLGNMNVLLSCRHNTGAVSLWGYPMRERFNELTIARVTLWQDTWGERQVSGVRDTYKKLILTSQWIRLTRKKTLPIFTVSFTFIKISTIRVKIDISSRTRTASAVMKMNFASVGGICVYDTIDAVLSRRHQRSWHNNHFALKVS